MNITFTGWGDWVVWFAAVLGGLAVIGRFVVRPALRGIRETVSLLRWLHDQFEARDGNGVKVREDITNIKQLLEKLQLNLDEVQARLPKERP